VIFAGLLAAHLAKFCARPATLVEDLRILPGRTGLAAASLSVLLLAAVIVPYSAFLATALLFAGLIWHAILAALMVRVFLAGPREQRKTTPAWHLSFVGFIVAPLSAGPLGYTGLAQGLLVATMVIAVAIYWISALQLRASGTPPPLRPLLAIHLAPFSLFGTTCVLQGMMAPAILFAALATAVLVVLLTRARYLTVAGFSPLWGAFTFPAAAYAGLMLALAGQGAPFRLAGAIALIAATIIVPLIAARVLRMWARGILATRTNAAVA
jgi:tellurite resistance protein